MNTDAISALESALPYDPDAPLRPGIERTSEELQVSVSWLRYTGIRKRRVTSILVEPEQGGPCPGLVCLHEARTSFLSEARALAADGFVSLLIDAPAMRPEPYTVKPDLHDPKSVRASYLQSIGDVRRGFDVLAQLEAVDRRRLGYVGRHYGADLAAAVAVLEPRVKAVVSIAGMPRQSGFWRESKHPMVMKRTEELGRRGVERLADAIADFDVITVIENAALIDWLFQFVIEDDLILSADTERLKRVAPEGARFSFHEDGRSLESIRPETERRRWLEEKLLLPP